MLKVVEEPGRIGVIGGAGAANGVFVKTTDSAGANRGFHLEVNYPAT